MNKSEFVDNSTEINFIQIHTKRTLLATKIREKWDAYFLKEHGNKPVHHLIEYGNHLH